MTEYLLNTLKMAAGANAKCILTQDEVKEIVAEMEQRSWHTGTPDKTGRYICTTGYGSVVTLPYSTDLYNVDDYDFKDKKGVGGFYSYDSEWGYYEVKGVKAWQNCPGPYEGVIE